MLLLLMEQDLAVRDLLHYALRLEGHEVEPVSRWTDLRDALDTGRMFDALVTDIVMPQEQGHAAALATARAQGVPVLLMTGDTHTMIELDARKLPYLGKPFQIEQLFEWIREQCLSSQTSDPNDSP